MRGFPSSQMQTGALRNPTEGKMPINTLQNQFAHPAASNLEDPSDEPWYGKVWVPLFTSWGSADFDVLPQCVSRVVCLLPAMSIVRSK